MSRTLAAMDGDRMAIDEVIEQSSRFTDDGRPLTDRPAYASIDLVYTLRALGYEDTGEPGTPVFRPRSTDAGTGSAGDEISRVRGP